MATQSTRIGRITVDVRKLTLRAFAALRGYEEQRELLRDVQATDAGAGLKQSDLSGMFCGGAAWPKARAAVAGVLFPSADFPRLDEAGRDLALRQLIENAAERRRKADA